MRKQLFGMVLLLGGVAGVCAPGCEQAPRQGPGHRKQALALTPKQELNLGEQAYQEVLSKYERVTRGPAVEKVREIGDRIVHAAEIKPLQREINFHYDPAFYRWEYAVLKSNQVNAFCLPGGKVAVFTGLLPVVEDKGQLNEDMLATIMAHEVSHALAHHSSERIAQQQMYEHAIDSLNGALGTLDPEKRKRLIGLLSAGAQIGSLPHDRMQESEADHIGLFLMTFAGYDPNAAVTLWERMQALSQQHGHTPEILSDHPSDAHRIQQIRRWIPAAQNALAAFKAGRIAPEH